MFGENFVTAIENTYNLHRKKICICKNGVFFISGANNASDTFSGHRFHNSVVNSVNSDSSAIVEISIAGNAVTAATNCLTGTNLLIFVMVETARDKIRIKGIIEAKKNSN